MNRERIRTVVVGVAGFPEEDRRLVALAEDAVLAPAAALAARLGATLHVVEAFERADPVGGNPMQSAAVLHRQRMEIEGRLWGQTRAFEGRVPIHCHAVEGDAAIQLCAFAEEAGADLLIVGATRGRKGWRKLLGSTAERVLQRTPIPVLVIRRSVPTPVRRVLLTTDLSDLSPALHEAALDALESLADTGEPEVRALLVCAYDMATAARLSPEQMSRAASRRLAEFLAHRRGRVLPVQGRVRIGNPSTEIIREGDDWAADLLVVGSHAGRGLARRLLGSTAAATLRGTSRNVLVIPAAWAVVREPGIEQAGSEQDGCGFPGTEEHHEVGAPLATL